MNLKDNMNTSADNSLLFGGGKGRGLSAVLFPGSFNPFTRGHADIVRRALLMFDEVVVGVGCNESKAGAVSPEERAENIRKLYAGNPRVRVGCYSGLTADFAKANGVVAIVRGVRSFADYEYEMQMADVNRQLFGIETIILPASPEFAALSSSVVRELLHFGHDVSDLLP